MRQPLHMSMLHPLQGRAAVRTAEGGSATVTWMGTMPAFLQMDRPAGQEMASALPPHLRQFLRRAGAQERPFKQIQHTCVSSSEGDAVHQGVAGEVVSNFASSACSRGVWVSRHLMLRNMSKGIPHRCSYDTQYGLAATPVTRLMTPGGRPALWKACTMWVAATAPCKEHASLKRTHHQIQQVRIPAPSHALHSRLCGEEDLRKPLCCAEN